MNTPVVKQFFNNKVTIRLKNGHRFEGLLSSINYKNSSFILQDVEDLGNQTDKNFIPHDKKLAQKGFQCDNIEEILFKEKHFCEPKKYNKIDFWDAISESVAQQPKYKQKTYVQKNERTYHKKNYQNRDNRDYRDNRDNRDNRGGQYRKKQGNYNKGNNYRNYEQKGQRKGYRKRQDNKEEENDRDYR